MRRTAAAAKRPLELGTLAMGGLPPPARSARGESLVFPPLGLGLGVNPSWTVKSQKPSWPGAQSRLKTTCDGAYSDSFMEELKATIGEENFEHFAEAMKPRVKPRGRGDPPPAGKPASAVKVPPPYKLRRAKAEPENLGSSIGQRALGELSSTTRSLMGTTSKSRVLDVVHTSFGPAPSHLYEDPEQANLLRYHISGPGTGSPLRATARPVRALPVHAYTPHLKYPNLES